MFKAIILSNILIVSLSIQSMEKDDLTTSKNYRLVTTSHTIDPKLQAKLNTIYDTAASLIPNINQTNDNFIEKFLNFLWFIKKYQTKHPGIDCHYLGSFSYTHESSLNSTFKEKMHYSASNLQVAIFFKMLEKHNAHLTKIKKELPSFQDWKNYKANKALPTEQAIRLGKSLGLAIHKTHINFNTLPFEQVNYKADIAGLQKFIQEIENLKASQESHVIKHLADMIFLNIKTPTKATQ